MQFNTLTPGLGVFASIPIDMKGDRIVTRLAGVAGSGYLNPGETWTNGIDTGRFSGFPDARAVPTDLLEFAGGTLQAGSYIAVTYVAADTSGNLGIYDSDVLIRDSNSVAIGLIATVDNPVEVVDSGETIPGVGQVTSVNDYFPTRSRLDSG